MKTLLLLLLSPFIIKAQIPYGDPQAYLMPPEPDTVVAVYDSIKSFIYWTSPPIPLNVQKEYVYDENLKIVSYTIYDLYDEWGDGYISDPYKNTYSYNDQGLLSEKIVWKLMDQNWSVISSFTYTYDEDGYLLSDTYNSNVTEYGWDEIHNLVSQTELSQGLDSTEAFFWAYDEDNNLLTQLWKGIWSDENEFRELQLSQFTYDDQDNHIGTLVLDKFETETWDTSKRITKTYDQQNLLVDSLVEDFKEEFLSTHTYLIYDENSNPDTVISFWMYPGYWENYQLELHDYDEMDRLISRIHHYWNTSDSSWIQNQWYTWEYDQNGNLIEEQLLGSYRISSVFDENNLLVSRVDSREEADSTHYYFKPQTIVKTPVLPQVQRLHVYPNPSTEKVTFMTKGIQSGTITISDASGRIITDIPVTGKETFWQPGKVSRGVYFFRFESEGKVSSGKVVIQ